MILDNKWGLKMDQTKKLWIRPKIEEMKLRTEGDVLATCHTHSQVSTFTGCSKPACHS